MYFLRDTNPDYVQEELDIFRNAYKKVQRFDGWDSNLDPIDLEFNYARSSQMWWDVEEGEELLTYDDFRRAKEYQEYLDRAPDYDIEGENVG